MTTSISISVVIVAYGNAGEVAESVASLAETTAGMVGEVIIVDNLGDPLLENLAAQVAIPTRVVRPSGNLGYGGGVNFGRRFATGKWLMVLNPDACVTSFDVDLCQLSKASGALLLGAKCFTDDGRPIPSSSAVFPSPLRDLLRELGVVSDGRHGWGEAVPPDAPLAWISGAAMLIPMAVFDRLRGFDPAFFLYYEDIDLCKRARDIGVGIRIWPGWTIRHALHSTTRDAARVVAWRYRSKLTYFAKHSNPAILLLHKAGSIAVLLAKMAFDTLWRHREGGSRMAGYRQSVALYLHSLARSIQ